jgi:hypothetical protein
MNECTRDLLKQVQRNGVLVIEIYVIQLLSLRVKWDSMTSRQLVLGLQAHYIGIQDIALY